MFDHVFEKYEMIQLKKKKLNNYCFSCILKLCPGYFVFY